MNQVQELEPDVLSEIYDAYRDPVFFAEHCLGHLTWSKQREILRSVRDYEKVAVKACHGVSKTYTAAELAVWFLNCFPESKVITTAPTFTQVKDLLWSEIGRIYRSSRLKLEGDCLTVSISTDHSEHYAKGFSTDQPPRAEGYHAPAILFILDEAKGLPQWMWDSFQGSLTGGFCRMLAISTTDGVNPGEQYEKCFKPDSGWHIIHISALHSPFISGEKFKKVHIPDLARLDVFEYQEVDPADVNIQIATTAWIADCKKKWGEDSVLFKTKVMGEIVDAGADTIIKLSQAMKMFENAKRADFDDTGEIEIGVDVARGGDDDTVFYKRKGLKIIDEKVITSADLPQKAKLVDICDKLELFAEGKRSIRIKIDDSGVGGGVTDIMDSRNYSVVPVNFQQKAKDSNHYANAITEMWYETAGKIDEISCPEDIRLQAELVNRKRLPLDKQGRLVIESKAEYKKRGFRSPDKADAFLLTFYNYRPRQDVWVLQGEDDGVPWHKQIEEDQVLPEDIEQLSTPENAKKYIALLRKHDNDMAKVAEDMGITRDLLRRWITMKREWIQQVGLGGGKAGEDVWVI